MDSTELYEHFRGDVFDLQAPYLWSDDEVRRYGADAHRMFVRLIGGIADITSSVCEVPVTAGETCVPIDPRVLKIERAYLLSSKHPVRIVNHTDLLATEEDRDYGLLSRSLDDPQPGTPRHLIIGAQENTGLLAVIPQVDDTIKLFVRRLPLSVITDEEQEIVEVAEEHHIHLVAWMKSLAYRKKDVETYSPEESRKYENEFRAYCAQVKAEQERKKHKTRAVQYGGI